MEIHGPQTTILKYNKRPILMHSYGMFFKHAIRKWKMNSNNKAAKHNLSLELFGILVGDWETLGSHPLVPDTVLHGQTSFKWLEGGAFLMMHSKIFYEGFPDTISIFGSDNALGTYFMLSFDERGISRIYEVIFQDNVLQWWRNEPGFSQRYSFTFIDNGNTIIGKGELSKDGLNWEKDLNLNYTRIG